MGEKEESYGEHTSGHTFSLTSAGPSCSSDAVLQQGSGSSGGAVGSRGSFMLSFCPHIKLGKRPVLLACHFMPLQAGFLPPSAQVVPQQITSGNSDCVSAKVCAWVEAELCPCEIIVDNWETQGIINVIQILISS